MANLPALAKAACITAFLLAGLAAVGAVWSGPLLMAPLALIPLLAGIGIARGRAWSSFGYALFLASELAAVFLLRSDSLSIALIPAALFILGIGILFAQAGRALRSAYGMRGNPFPWVALSVATLLLSLVFQPFVQNSNSMANTLLAGDKVFVERLPNAGRQRGDLVAFHYPVDRREIYLKRIIGVPGDRIHLVDKTVYRNGVALVEPYALHETTYVDAYRDNFPAKANVRLSEPAKDMLERNVNNGEVVVPPGSYFVLGDNRDDSLDSRYFGFVPAADLIGKPLLIYDSRPAPGAATRWNRLFRKL